eukprot:SAG11_NODE_12569_length_696_cov_5.050251_1_plen_40_part_10
MPELADLINNKEVDRLWLKYPFLLETYLMKVVEFGEIYNF